MGQSESCIDEPTDKGEVHVRYVDGTVSWLQCGRYENLVQNPGDKLRERFSKKKIAAAAAGASFVIKTERDFADRMIEFGNWLTLCGAMTRGRDFSCHIEASALVQLLAERDVIAIKYALESQSCDPALMIATIARGLANGTISADLATNFLSTETIISTHKENNRPAHRVAVSASESIRPQDPLHENRRTARIPELWKSSLNSQPRPAL